jgi:hypothetical protein
MSEYELQLVVEADITDDELDQHRRTLQAELNALDDVATAGQISVGKAPDGSRAEDLLLLGAIAVSLKQAGVFDAIVSVLKTWIETGNRRKEKRKVIIKRPDGATLQFDGYSLKEIEGLRTTNETADI